MTEHSNRYDFSSWAIPKANASFYDPIACSENWFVAADGLRSALADLQDANELLRKLVAATKNLPSSCRKDLQS